MAAIRGTAGELRTHPLDTASPAVYRIAGNFRYRMNYLNIRTAQDSDVEFIEVE